MSTQFQLTQETSIISNNHTATKRGTASFVRGTYLVLNFGDGNTSLPLRPTLRTTLGRTPTNTTQTPDIDLASYNAGDLGVSRIHAAIHQNDDTLTIMDMGSRNGTHLNGQRLMPGQQRILRDGDELRLGKLVAHVQFKYGTVPLAPMNDPKATNKLDDMPGAPYAQPEPISALPRVSARKHTVDGEIGDTPTGSSANSVRAAYILPDFVGRLGQTSETPGDTRSKNKFHDRIRDLVNQAAPVQSLENRAPIEPRQDASMPPAQPESSPLHEEHPRNERPASSKEAKSMLGRLQQ